MAGLISRNGRYYAEFYDANRTPKSKRYALGTSRKDVARRKLAQWERDFELGRLDPWLDDPRTYDLEQVEHLSIASAQEQFLQKKKADGRTRNTLRAYREVVGLFARHIGKDTLLSAVTASQIDTFVRDSLLSKATQHKRYRHLRAFLRWCVAQEFLRKNPLNGVEKPQKPAKLPKAVTEAELQTICTSIREDYQAKLRNGEAAEGQMIWMIPLFRFALYTGLRSSELGRLRWGHIDFDKSLIYIRKQKNKKEQTIPLNSKALEVLSDVERGDKRDFVFTSPRQTSQERNVRSFVCNTARKFARYRKKAGIDRKVTVHGLRHGFCTLLAEAGKSAVIIKEAARHADISTSMRYVHMANEHLKAELDDVFG